MADAPAAVRKTVSVLFCDLVESTALGDGVDPETLRTLLSRWHAEMRDPVERHGGTVEKFIGDALMAVFGIPYLHEDDALRAVRAAVQMRAALERLNDNLAAESRGQLQIRIGINTGEVVTGDGSTTLVTGDAVNTAKRLEEAARPNEILVGDATRRLVSNAATLEPVTEVRAKGKRAPIEAWRIVDVIAGASTFFRRLDAPLVGRQDELGYLRGELDIAWRERTCRLVTVYGAAGIGKSRLAAELVAEANAHAQILSARCVPYGDGITFLPLTELIRSAGGEEAVAAAVAGEADGALIRERVSGALGLEAPRASSEETFWAIRRLFETLARERALVVWLEDVHWAEPTFLDLVEYVAGWSRDAPILLLCVARPDLLEERPRWPGAAITLHPLTETESESLLDALAAEWPLTPATRARITDAAEGNPLFVEQMVAMLAEGEQTEVVVPATIHALLAARIDQLEPLERSLLERAAVAGKEFSRAAIVELSPADEHSSIGATLLSLVRKELLRPERTQNAGDDGLRFRHALVRDAAYGEIPKTRRADLHEQFAAWLQKCGGEGELVGYHLEEAFRCRADLGDLDDTLAERAAKLLADAGRRAHARDDMPAAANLLERALALAELEDERAELLRELGIARWRLGDAAGASGAFDDAIAVAVRIGDARQEWTCRLENSARLRMLRAGDDDLVAVAAEAIRVFSSFGDDIGLARAWRRLALVSMTDWHFAEAATRAERAIEHARRAGDSSDDVALADTYCTALLYGPAYAPAAAQQCHELLATLGGDRVVRAAIVSSLGGLVAMQGSFDDARALAAEAAATFDELGARMTRAGLAEVIAEIERLAGDVDAAERELRFARDVFIEAGATALAGLPTARLVPVLIEQGRVDEAEEMLAAALASARERDIAGHVAGLLAGAQVAAARGRNEEAVQLADEALGAFIDSDALPARAEVLAVRAAAAGVAPQDAIALHEQKGNVAAAARLRELVKTRATR